MKKLMVSCVVLLVVAAFAATGWQFWEARQQQQALAARLDSAEDRLDAVDRQTALLRAAGEGVIALDARLNRLEGATFDGQVPTRSFRGSLDERIDALEDDLAELQDTVPNPPVMDTSAIDIANLEAELSSLRSRVGRVCGALQQAADGLDLC